MQTQEDMGKVGARLPGGEPPSAIIGSIVRKKWREVQVTFMNW